MEHEVKLKRFQSAVFSEIETRNAKMSAEFKAEFEEKLKENTDRQLQISYDDIQRKTADIKKDTKRELAKMGLENKRTLITKRNELVEDIFDNIKTKIKEYIKTQEYQDYFLDEIENFYKKYEISDIEIYVGDIDINKKVYIEKAYKLPCNVILDKNIDLGGFAIKDTKNNFYYDYTLGNKLNINRVEFFTNSDFSL